MRKNAPARHTSGAPGFLHGLQTRTSRRCWDWFGTSTLKWMPFACGAGTEGLTILINPPIFGQSREDQTPWRTVCRLLGRAGLAQIGAASAL